MTTVDARGVPIAPGDTAIYPYTVGSSSAYLAEAVVLGEESCEEVGSALVRTEKVSLTLLGRVRLRVVWRGCDYYPDAKQVVAVAPERLVVLKRFHYAADELLTTLPPEGGHR